MTDDVMKLIVHPGIGDLSWLISKLSTTGKQFDFVIAEDAKTRRSMPLVDMIPCIRSAEYGGMDIYGALTHCGNCKWSDYEQAWKDGQDLYITANWWVDAGKRLEGFLPDLDTDFHYPIQLPEQDEQWAKDLCNGPDNIFGIYASSSAGISIWQAWSVNEWTDFICAVFNNFPRTQFAVMGAKWDMDFRAPLLRSLQRACIPYIDLCGRTTLQQATALIKHMHYFAGFASGLTIFADVLNTPVLMLYAKHMTKLMHSWPDPDNMKSGQYIARTWSRSIDVFGDIKPLLDKYLVK